MKHFILLATLLIGSIYFIQAQESYVMYENTYLMPNPESGKDFGEAMAKHNKDFHSGGPYHANVWMVTTGQYAGYFVWSMGPCTFTHLDSRPDDKDHTDDWVNNVMPHVKKIGETGYWRRADNISYTPEDSVFTKLMITVYDLEDWQSYRFKEIVGKVAKVYHEKKYDHLFSTYFPSVDMPYERDAAIVWGFRKYADLDKDMKFKADFEEVHGEGSWQKVMDEYKDVVVNSIDEIWELVPAMSGTRE